MKLVSLTLLLSGVNASSVDAVLHRYFDLDTLNKPVGWFWVPADVFLLSEMVLAYKNSPRIDVDKVRICVFYIIIALIF